MAEGQGSPAAPDSVGPSYQESGVAVLRGADFVFEHANEAFRAIAPERQVLGRPLADVFPEALTQLLPAVRQVLADGRPFEVADLPVPLRDGSGRLVARSFTFSWHRLEEAGGEAVLLVLARESRRPGEVRRAPDEAEEVPLPPSGPLVGDAGFLAAVLEQVPAGMVVAAAPSGRVMLANARSGQPCAASRPGEDEPFAEARGYHPDGRPYAPGEWPLARSLSTGEVVTDEPILVDRGGERRLLRVSSAPVRDSDGHIVAAVAFDTDATDTLDGELALREEMARTSLLRDVASAAASSLSVGEVCGRVLQAVQTRVGASAGAVHSFDEEERRLDQLAALGVDASAATSVKVEGGGALADLVRGGKSCKCDVAAEGPPCLAALLPARPGSSRLGLPIPARGRTIGVLSLEFETSGAFGEDEIALYSAVAEQLGIAMDHARIYETEHHIAQTLQRSLLSLPSQVEGLEFDAYYASATEEAWVGGDFYDVFDLPSGHVALLVGDVSGKGLEAAALTALAKNALKAHAVEGDPPAEVVRKTNEAIVRFSDPDTFVTVIYAVLDRHGGHMRYCSAGHPPAILVRADGLVETLGSHGSLVGAFPGLDYPEDDRLLLAGDTLLLYTDGVIEARRDGEQYAEERLLASVRRATGLSPTALVEHVVADLLTFTSGRLRDDIALLAVRVGGR